MPLFSIIIPVYNMAPYLRECLDSVFAQNCTDYEVCMVDDGSNDGSSAICDEYSQRYPGFVKLLHQPNQGVSVARNNALDMATGSYIWFVDADDYILPDSIAYLQKIIYECGSDTIFFGQRNYAGEHVMSYECDDRDAFLKTHICFWNQYILFDRHIIEDNALRFTKGLKVGEDMEFQFKYLLNCVRPIALEYNFYRLRNREGSASRSATSFVNNFYDCQILLSNILSYLQWFKGTDNRWIQGRIDERLKSFLRSASGINGVNWHEVQNKYDYFVQSYKELGFSDIAKGSLRFANINVRLYGFLYRIILKINRAYIHIQ